MGHCYVKISHVIDNGTRWSFEVRLKEMSIFKLLVSSMLPMNQQLSMIPLPRKKISPLDFPFWKKTPTSLDSNVFLLRQVSGTLRPIGN